jgi:hypothetical protein
MTIRPELIDELLEDCSDPRDVLAEGGLLKQLTKARGPSFGLRCSRSCKTAG